MTTEVPVKVERTNFEGSANEVCPHCNQTQQKHFIHNGPINGVLYEHRMPCAPEKEKMRLDTRRVVVTVKIVVLIGWILVPIAYLFLQQFVSVVGWIAFGIGIFQLLLATIKYFGNPDKWIPGYKEKMEKKAKHAHFIYHCERNPEGFARLRNENFTEEE